MKIHTLKNRILLSFFTVILVLAVIVFCLGYGVIQKQVFQKTQKQVNRYLDSARTFYNSEIEAIGARMNLAAYEENLEEIRKKLDLDYLFRIHMENVETCESRIVRFVHRNQKSAGGTRLVSERELERMNSAVRQRTHILLQETPKAKPTDRTHLSGAMAKEYALPIQDQQGNLQSVIYGGRIINQDYSFVDKLRSLVFGDELYHEKPVGTVTIFQDDTRISTNVLDENGRRAIGTRVSEEVYTRVIEEGQRWHDRALVVTHWYKSAYEPIRDIEGNIIGILYVGILEEQLTDIAAKVLYLFLVAVAAASVMAGILAFILAGSVSRPITHLMGATRQMSDGQWGHPVPLATAVLELNQLAASFNEMSAQLQQRETSLKISNEKLADLNKSYLDLIGFVAHELKGMLASAVINAYSIRDGLLGMVNFKQKKAVDSICRNLDYLDATVKKFLNLSRIEREKLEINRHWFFLRTEVFDVSLQTFAKMIENKKMKVVNEIDPDLKIHADQDLMQIVSNNLVNNAAKYGMDGGQIRLAARPENGRIEVEVYNDGRPIQPEQVPQLFKKFSRLDNPEKKKVKGTGLGLYITKQILEAHGGDICVEPRDHGNAFIFHIERE